MVCLCPNLHVLYPHISFLPIGSDMKRIFTQFNPLTLIVALLFVLLDQVSPPAVIRLISCCASPAVIYLGRVLNS